jgi:hypothetical protein
VSEWRPLSSPLPRGVGGCECMNECEPIWKFSQISRGYRTVPYVTKKRMGTVPPFWTKSTMDSASRTVLYKKKKLLITLCTLYRRYVPKYHIVVFNKNNTVTLKFLTAAYMPYTLLRSPDLHPPGSLYRWLGVKLCIRGVGTLCV